MFGWVQHCPNQPVTLTRWRAANLRPSGETPTLERDGDGAGGPQQAAAPAAPPAPSPAPRSSLLYRSIDPAAARPKVIGSDACIRAWPRSGRDLKDQLGFNQSTRTAHMQAAACVAGRGALNPDFIIKPSGAYSRWRERACGGGVGGGIDRSMRRVVVGKPRQAGYIGLSVHPCVSVDGSIPGLIRPPQLGSHHIHRPNHTPYPTHRCLNQWRLPSCSRSRRSSPPE